MAHQQVGADRAGAIQSRSQLAQRSEAEPVHARVEMQRRGRRPPACREGRPPREFIGAADHGREVLRRIVRRRIGLALQAVEHVNSRFRRQDGAGARAFARVRDEKHAATGGVQRRRGGLDADAVSVGLDHRRAAPGGRAARQLAPIPGERLEVDRQHAGGVRGHGGGAVHASPQPVGRPSIETLFFLLRYSAVAASPFAAQ